jgi:hypothetical protein
VPSPFSSAGTIYNRTAAVFVVICLSLSGALGGEDFSREALAQFLAGEIAPDVLEFGETRVTREDILNWLRRLRTSRQPKDRGIAVANLQNCAWVLLSVPATKPVAMELLDRWVLPNATLLRSLPRTSACSWENVMMGAYACYKKGGDAHGERRALELLSTQARDPGLRDLAILRLAGLKADQGSLKEAIDIARKSDSRGELSEHRTRLLQTWQQELKSKKSRP